MIGWTSRSVDERNAVLGRRLLWITVRGLFRTILHLSRTRVFGQTRVPHTGGLILASNHQSFFDPPLLSVPLNRMSSFMARSTLFESKIFGSIITGLNSFPVERGTADKKAVQEAIRRLKAGWSVILFPEATRTRDGKMGELKSGVAMIADRAKVPIVPVALIGADKAWPRTGGPRLRPIGVWYGPPITVEDRAGMHRDEVTALLRERIEEGMAFLTKRDACENGEASPA
jgi:1-acyl-sn-glycerol-3-phosphate acyltransferase